AASFSWSTNSKSVVASSIISSKRACTCGLAGAGRETMRRHTGRAFVHAGLIILRRLVVALTKRRGVTRIRRRAHILQLTKGCGSDTRGKRLIVHARSVKRRLGRESKRRHFHLPPEAVRPSGQVQSKPGGTWASSSRPCAAQALATDLSLVSKPELR